MLKTTERFKYLGAEIVSDSRMEYGIPGLKKGGKLFHSTKNLPGNENTKKDHGNNLKRSILQTNIDTYIGDTVHSSWTWALHVLIWSRLQDRRDEIPQK